MIRITGGLHRGRRLRTRKGDATRPSADVHRETLMNILATRVEGGRVLDLFAGSGAFALECLSRGADSAVLVEKARPALAVIAANVEMLGVEDDVRVVAGDAYAVPVQGEFDLVFVAPPYPQMEGGAPRTRKAVEALAERGHLAADARVIVQSGTGQFSPEGLAGFVLDRERPFGRTMFHLLSAAIPR